MFRFYTYIYCVKICYICQSIVHICRNGQGGLSSLPLHSKHIFKSDRDIVRRWVKNYPHYRYMFCSWLYCWLSMTKYTWSTPLVLLWCRCDLDSPFLSWVFYHKHGHSQFHLHQRRAEGSDPFLWAEGVPGVEKHRMMSVQYENSVMSQRIVC